MELFSLNPEVTKLQPSEVTLEKNLQKLIEDNMEKFFNVRFLKSEYKITEGRMDSIGIDENYCPVIFEYKRGVNENVINQGLFYLDWLMDHRGDFKQLVLEKLLIKLIGIHRALSAWQAILKIMIYTPSIKLTEILSLSVIANTTKI